MNDDFADYIGFWKHNGYWLFDSPSILVNLAREAGIDLTGTSLFYFEAHEMEFDGAVWVPFTPESSIKTDVELPAKKTLEGFDVATFEEAKSHLSAGSFNNAEPGPYRIVAVYSVDWTVTDN